jgi:hypothetical protein
MKTLAVILAVLLVMSPLWAVDSICNKRITPNTARLVNPPSSVNDNVRVQLPPRPQPLTIESILLVDDDGGTNNGGTYTDIQNYYTAALTAAGYSYDLCVVNWVNPLQSGPNADSMSHYDCVIWFCGETWGYYGQDVLTATDEANLAAYLSSGGTLFLNAQDYLYASYPSAGSFSPGQFPYDYLGVSSVTQDFQYPNPPAVVAGVSGSYAHGLSYNVTNPYPQATIYADSFVPRDHNLLNVTSPSPTGACAVQFQGSNFRTAFSTCGVEGLVNGTYQVSAYLDSLLGGLGYTDVPLTHQPAVVTHYSLAQNYPNPFNPTTDIRYQLPVQGNVTLTIYNTTGQEIATLINGHQAAGTYQVTWDAGNLPSGVYFYRLTVNGFQDVRRMMLIK